MTSRTQQAVLHTLGALALAVAFIACGFAVCAGIPQVTEQLARATSADELSPFDKDQLVRAAVATRDYTVETADRDALMEVIAAINDEADTPYAGAGIDALEGADESYTLTPDALSHLDDVHAVVERLLFPMVGCALLAGFCLIGSVFMWGPRSVGRPLAWAGAAVLIAFAALGLWALIDFNGLFALIHSLFFAAGTWTFPADSLLICMYPQAFWMGMGAVWLAVTVCLSILSLVSGIVFIRQRRRLEFEEIVPAEAEEAAAGAGNASAQTASATTSGAAALPADGRGDARSAADSDPDDWDDDDGYWDDNDDSYWDDDDDDDSYWDDDDDDDESSDARSRRT